MSALRLDQLLASAAYRNLMKKWSRRRLIAERQANVRFGSKADIKRLRVDGLVIAGGSVPKGTAECD